MAGRPNAQVKLSEAEREQLLTQYISIVKASQPTPLALRQEDRVPAWANRRHSLQVLVAKRSFSTIRIYSSPAATDCACK